MLAELKFQPAMPLICLYTSFYGPTVVYTGAGLASTPVLTKRRLTDAFHFKKYTCKQAKWNVLSHFFDKERCAY